MSRRYKGAILSSTAANVTSSVATGAWTVQTQMQQAAANTWPGVGLPVTNRTLTPAQAAALDSYGIGDTITFTNTNDVQTFSKKNASFATVTCVGASGNDGNAGARGGGGGTVSGRVDFTQATYYVYVGGRGTTGVCNTVGGTGGYNGGGSILDTGNSGWIVAGAGGASDIRLVGGAWNNATSLNSRILVGGGGGAGSRNGGSSVGGVGAYPTGGNGTTQDGSGGFGGTQSAGGAGGTSCTNNCGEAFSWPGTFGAGGNIFCGCNHLGGPGGGGWYGGGTGANHMGGGGGGSSYYNANYVTNFSHTSGTVGSNNTGQVVIVIGG